MNSTSSDHLSVTGRRRPTPAPSAARSASGLDWPTLLLWTGGALPVGLVAALVAVRRLVVPVVVLALVYVAGTLLVRRRPRVAAVVLAIPSALLLVRNVPHLPAVLSAPAATVDFLTAVMTAALAAATLLAAVAVLAGRPRGRGARLVAVATVVVLLAAVAGATTAAAAGAAPAAGNPETQPGDVRLAAEDVAFSADRIEVEAGRVAVVLENRDAMLHTFTVDDLGVDLQVPANSTGRVVFDAPAGTYEFVCTPHAAVMRGTLVVR